MSIGQGGRVVFEEFASFEENWSGRGGALCNRGSAEFFRRSFFNGNTASGKLSGVLVLRFCLEVRFCLYWHQVLFYSYPVR